MTLEALAADPFSVLIFRDGQIASDLGRQDLSPERFAEHSYRTTEDAEPDRWVT